MAFAYTSGVATSVDDWFSIFEAWITGTVGWTVESGTGTTNLVLSSDGEAADKTKLFVNVFRDISVSYPYRIHGEVRDDAAGTHKTAENGYIQALSTSAVSDTYSFYYAFSANKDAIVLTSRDGYRQYLIYLGLVEPFALSPPDETYYMIATGTSITVASVLRNGAGTWDFDISCYRNEWIGTSGLDMQGNLYFPIGSMIAGNATNIIGQLYHIGCYYTANVNQPQLDDTLTSVLPSGTATWIISQSTTYLYSLAIRTGGTLSSDAIDDGAHYAYTTGTATSITQFFSILRTLLGQVGWNETDFSGSSGYTEDWLFDSTGESGNETIYIRIYWNTASILTMVIQDDANYVPGHSYAGNNNVNSSALPTTFHITADLDCILLALYDSVSGSPVYRPLWGGLVISYIPDIPAGSEYRTAILHYYSSSAFRLDCYVLRTHDGDWIGFLSEQLYYGDGTHNNNDNPLAVDGTTYMIYPEILYDLNAASSYVIYGRAKYLFHIGSANIAIDDTITVGSRIYTVLRTFNGSTTYSTYYCIRSDGGMYSSSSSSSSSS